MRIAVLVKQIPKFEEMELGPDGRLRRDGIEPEMNPYCRRAVSKAVELAAERAGLARHGVHARSARGRRHAARGDRVGPRTRRRHRRRARHRRRVRGLRHARDRAGARGRARAARAAARSTSCSPAATRSTPTPARSGPSSPSCSTCPFLTGVRHLAIEGTLGGRALRARRRLDAGRGRAPGGAVVRGAAVRADEGRPARPRRGARRAASAASPPPTSAPGPWGADASPTWVGPVKVMAVSRARRRRIPTRRSPSRCATPCTCCTSAARCATTAADARAEVVPRAARRSVAGPRSRSSPSPTARTRPASCSASRRASRPRSTAASPRSRSRSPSRVLLGVVGRRRHRAPRRRQRRRRRRGARWPRGREVEPRRGRSSPARPRGAARSRHASRPGSAPASPATRSTSKSSEGRLVAWKPAFGGQLVAAIGATSRDPDGDGARRHDHRARTALRRRSSRTCDRIDAAVARPRARARPHRATTISTRSPKPRS